LQTSSALFFARTRVSALEIDHCVIGLLSCRTGVTFFLKESNQRSNQRASPLESRAGIGFLLAFPRSLRPTGYGQGAKTTFAETAGFFLRILLECAAAGAYGVGLMEISCYNPTVLPAASHLPFQGRHLDLALICRVRRESSLPAQKLLREPIRLDDKIVAKHEVVSPARGDATEWQRGEIFEILNQRPQVVSWSRGCAGISARVEGLLIPLN
jgi:hypothetical protein